MGSPAHWGAPKGPSCGSAPDFSVVSGTPETVTSVPVFPLGKSGATDGAVLGDFCYFPFHLHSNAAVS